jgi:hypothetical protein
LELTVDPQTLGRLQKKRHVLAELPAHDFLAALGLGAAGTQFDYLRHGEIEPTGFEIVELRYRKPGFDPMHEFDLHRIEAKRSDDAAAADGETGGPPTLALPLQVRAMIAFARTLSLILRPLFWLARPWLRWRFARQMRSAPPALVPSSGVPSTVGLVPGTLPGTHEHCALGFRLRLPREADLQGTAGIFRWRGIDVTVALQNATFSRQVLAAQAGPSVLETRDFFAGELPARAWIRDWPGREGKFARVLHVYVASHRGVYSFTARSVDPAQTPPIETLSSLAESFSTFELTELPPSSSPALA